MVSEGTLHQAEEALLHTFLLLLLRLGGLAWWSPSRSDGGRAREKQELRGFLGLRLGTDRLFYFCSILLTKASCPSPSGVGNDIPPNSGRTSQGTEEVARMRMVAMMEGSRGNPQPSKGRSNRNVADGLEVRKRVESSLASDFLPE